MTLGKKLLTIKYTKLKEPLSIDDALEILRRSELNYKHGIKKVVLEEKFPVYGILFCNMYYPKRIEAGIKFHPYFKRIGDKYTHVDIYSNRFFGFIFTGKIKKVLNSTQKV